jgi:chaperonin GroEL (HSP60 family)
VVNKLRGALKNFVKAWFGDREAVEDIAILTGGTVISEERTTLENTRNENVRS